MMNTCPECETTNGHSVDCTRSAYTGQVRSSLVDEYVAEHLAVARAKTCERVATTYGWAVGGRVIVNQRIDGSYSLSKDYGLSLSDLADLQVAIEAAIRAAAVAEVEGA